MPSLRTMQELLELGLTPNGMNSPRARELLAALEAEDIEKEKGKNPVGFLLSRFDFSSATFPIGVEQHPFKREECRLVWWPDGKEARTVREELSPATMFSEFVTSDMVVRERRVEPRELRYDFAVSEHEAMRSPEWIVKSLTVVFERQSGVRPVVISEREAFYRIYPERRAPFGAKP